MLEATLLAGARPATIRRLKQIGIALHNYHDAFRHFPPPAIRDDRGKPLLSWRVAILPFLEQAELYGQFQLDQSWDSPHNMKLLARIPEVYRCGVARVPDGHTVYLAPRGEGTVFLGPEGLPIRQITDGTSKTIAIVEASDDHAVPWTKPEDWPYDPDQPLKGLGGHFGDRFLTVFCDGAMHALPATIDPDTLRLLITYGDRRPVRIPD